MKGREFLSEEKRQNRREEQANQLKVKTTMMKTKPSLAISSNSILGQLLIEKQAFEMHWQDAELVIKQLVEETSFEAISSSEFADAVQKSILSSYIEDQLLAISALSLSANKDLLQPTINTSTSLAIYRLTHQLTTISKSFNPRGPMASHFPKLLVTLKKMVMSVPQKCGKLFGHSLYPNLIDWLHESAFFKEVVELGILINDLFISYPKKDSSKFESLAKAFGSKALTKVSNLLANRFSGSWRTSKDIEDCSDHKVLDSIKSSSQYSIEVEVVEIVSDKDIDYGLENLPEHTLSSDSVCLPFNLQLSLLAMSKDCDVSLQYFFSNISILAKDKSNKDLGYFFKFVQAKLRSLKKDGKRGAELLAKAFDPEDLSLVDLLCSQSSSNSQYFMRSYLTATDTRGLVSFSQSPLMDLLLENPSTYTLLLIAQQFESCLNQLSRVHLKKICNLLQSLAERADWKQGRDIGIAVHLINRAMRHQEFGDCDDLDPITIHQQYLEKICLPYSFGQKSELLLTENGNSLFWVSGIDHSQTRLPQTTRSNWTIIKDKGKIEKQICVQHSQMISLKKQIFFVGHRLVNVHFGQARFYSLVPGQDFLRPGLEIMKPGDRLLALEEVFNAKAGVIICLVRKESDMDERQLVVVNLRLWKVLQVIKAAGLIQRPAKFFLTKEGFIAVPTEQDDLLQLFFLKSGELKECQLEERRTGLHAVDNKVIVTTNFSILLYRIDKPNLELMAATTSSTYGAIKKITLIAPSTFVAFYEYYLPDCFAVVRILEKENKTLLVQRVFILNEDVRDVRLPCKRAPLSQSMVAFAKYSEKGLWYCSKLDRRMHPITVSDPFSCLFLIKLQL